ncbi:AMP-dependent synthetase [Trinickia symbiotica]|uniref:AMP-dependent synthetase n=1 Tax=Trinickia symbiotica TaxID=863227 RepID=A0A2T3XKK8_9BURK|nr:AMP-binding protein [Trinickia symbiotica]PTB17065.1 AMP-dependent synthetase [Trinickia symbiotica]
MAHFSADDNIPKLLRDCAAGNPEHVFCRSGEVSLTYAELNVRVNRLANGLSRLGVRAQTRVAVMLSHHVDHALAYFALCKLGAVQVPVNVHLKGAALEHVLVDSEPAIALADDVYASSLDPAAARLAGLRVIWRPENGGGEFARLCDDPDESEPEFAAQDADLRAILYTSGTSGPAKGVLMSDRMYRAAALGSSWIGSITPGSVLHFWDPIYHVFGSEVLVMALMQPITLAFVPRFSASGFWDEVARYRATHLHFVGGVLQLLLKQPPSLRDRDHTLRVAWGGGAPVEVWQAFEERFGIPLREGYGMTETSSFSVVNLDGRVGSIGKAVDYFDVQIVGDDDCPLPPGSVGEIRVAAREPGTITEGYFRNPEKTRETLRHGWLYTGDLGRQDTEGYFFFLGRKKDSVRRRGENISAWEVENVANGHPDVEESALIGVTNEFGDEDLKLFVKLRPGAAAFTPETFVAWCEANMAKFQVPRFIALVDEFPKTPTQRIQKQSLSKRIDDCWDALASPR